MYVTVITPKYDLAQSFSDPSSGVNLSKLPLKFYLLYQGESCKVTGFPGGMSAIPHQNEGTSYGSCEFCIPFSLLHVWLRILNM